MGNTVIILVFKDRNGVYENGVERAVSKFSTPGDTGFINLRDEFDVNINIGGTIGQVMELTQPNGQKVYTNETEASWHAKLHGTGGGGSGGSDTETLTVEYKIGVSGDYPVGNTIINTLLHGITIHELFVSGSGAIMGIEDIHDPAYTGLLGRLRFGDLPGGGMTLNEGDTVRITYEATI